MSTHLRDHANDAKSAATSAIKSAVKDTSTLTSDLIDKGLNKASASVSDVAGFADKSLEAAKERAGALAKTAQETARPYVQSAGKTIRKHPVVSVAAALAVGVLVTSVVGKIMRSAEA